MRLRLGSKILRVKCTSSFPAASFDLIIMFARAHHRNFTSSTFLERDIKKRKNKKTKTRLNTILHLSIISPVPCVSLKTRLVLFILKLVYLCTKRIPKAEICKPAGSSGGFSRPNGHTLCGVPCGRCRFNLAPLSLIDGEPTKHKVTII